MIPSLLAAVVPHDCGDDFMQAAKKAGAGGGTVVMARGYSSSSLLNVLGLGDVFFDLVYIIIDEPQREPIRAALITHTKNEKHDFGVLFEVNVTKFIRLGVLNNSEKDSSMQENTPYEMITLIVNKGYADDAMAAARKAGAGGGTIVYAHGTGKEEDAKFFGITIVPEKEMLIILIERDKTDAVVEAIRALPCLSEPGIGIAFSVDVTDFTVLGKSKKQ
jgi:nitrogen regulatory protein PII